MPIITLQRSMRRLGRIRMGNQVKTSSGKMRPNKLDKWRLTSPYQEILQAAADMYGGQIHPWEGAPTSQPQWELYAETNSLDILIPPGDLASSQFYEMWSGGGCVRRCDGQSEQFTGDSCLCPADKDQRLELAARGQACKPTTRLFVIQPQLPDVGLWHAEFHGYYAAVEIPGSLEILQMASANGGLIPAKLTIEQRQVKRQGETRNFAVPVIELPTLTAHTLMTGEVPAGQLAAGAPAAPPGPAAVAPAAQQALPAPAPAPAKRAAKKQAAPAQQAGGSAFTRAIKATATRLHIDDAALESVCQEIAGVPLADVHDPAHANSIMQRLTELAGPQTPASAATPDPLGEPF